MRIFQSTLPRRERPNHYAICIILYYFNPRSREGSDGSSHDVYKTLCQFQSTLPRRERPRFARLFILRKRFQSTLPRRERRSRGAEHSVHGDFNPRSREGSDSGAAFYICIKLISIHAPAKGATCKCFKYMGYTLISIHAPAKGATVWGN